MPTGKIYTIANVDEIQETPIKEALKIIAQVPGLNPEYYVRKAGNNSMCSFSINPKCIIKSPEGRKEFYEQLALLVGKTLNESTQHIFLAIKDQSHEFDWLAEYSLKNSLQSIQRNGEDIYKLLKAGNPDLPAFKGFSSQLGD